MRRGARPDPLTDAAGVSFVELMVAMAIFVFVIFGFGSLYLSAQRAYNYGSAESYAQRQGTLIQEELLRHMQGAVAMQVAACAETSPGSLPANRSVIYTRYFPARAAGSQFEYWCIYEYQRAGQPYSQLWRCPLADASPSQTCTGGTAKADTLLPDVPFSAAGGQRAEVLNTSITPAPVAAATTSVDFRFDIDLHAQTTNDSLLWAPRRFGFNVTLRN